jgi:hypothetical protein
LTQERLAELSGVSAHSVSVLERRRRSPRLSSVSVLAAALKLTEEEHARLIRSTVGPAERGPAPAAVGAGPVRPAQLPADLSDFTGRGAEVAALVKALTEPAAQPPGAPRVCVVSGPRGIGKSVLAVHTSHLLASRYPDGQLFADMRGSGTEPASPRRVLERFLRALGGAGLGDSADEEELAAAYRGLVAGRRVLIVLDDARDPAQIRPLLPASSGCAVLVTARRSAVGFEGARGLRVGALARSRARLLLERIAGAAVEQTAPHELAALLAACAGVPRAVRLAAELLAAEPDGDPARRLAAVRSASGHPDRVRGVSVEDRLNDVVDVRGNPEHPTQAWIRDPLRLEQPPAAKSGSRHRSPYAIQGEV